MSGIGEKSATKPVMGTASMRNLVATGRCCLRSPIVLASHRSGRWANGIEGHTAIFRNDADAVDPMPTIEPTETTK